MGRRGRLPKATPLSTTAAPLAGTNKKISTSQKETESPKPVKLSDSGSRLVLPKVCNYKTSYTNDFVKKERGKQITPHVHSPTRKNRPHPTKFKLTPHPQSPYRKNRPHPIKVNYLRRLGKSSDFVNILGAQRTNPLVCKVETENRPSSSVTSLFNSLSVKDSGFLFPTSNMKESYGIPELTSESRTTRFGSKKKTSPARGILPMIKKDWSLTKCPETEDETETGEREEEGEEREEHLLPGTLALTTTMWAQGPYHYVPRKRKHFVVSRSAAGVTGGLKEERYRYHKELTC